MGTKLRFLLGTAAVFAALAMPSTALADMACAFSSPLNAPNVAVAPYAPPSGSFGNLCVNLIDSNTATITFQALDGYLIGGAQALDLNINTAAGPFTLGVAATQFPTHSAPVLTVQAPPGVGMVGEQGTFNVVIDDFAGFPYTFKTATVTVNLTSGIFADAASVLAFNSAGRDAAAHIFVCGDASCTVAAGSPQTGTVGETAATVPEPTSIALCAGIVLFVASRLRKRAA